MILILHVLALKEARPPRFCVIQRTITNLVDKKDRTEQDKCNATTNVENRPIGIKHMFGGLEKHNNDCLIVSFGNTTSNAVNSSSSIVDNRKRRPYKART